MINLFNWKKYPANALILAIPLASLGLGLMILLAYLHSTYMVQIDGLTHIGKDNFYTDIPSQGSLTL